MNNKYFTKSAFKLAFECPTKLYYACDNSYANQDVDNEFLQALANGGFQVGELAKIYYGITDVANIEELDYDTALHKTQELFKQENVNIAEAAFKSGNLFVRADIIEKKGHHINLIEVKAKSWSNELSFEGKRGGIPTGIKPYVYDVAFQKYVIARALKELYPNESFTIHAYLMMADKGTIAPVDGVNQMFKIINNGKGKGEIVVNKEAKNLAKMPRVLTAFDVDELCGKIINNQITQQDTFEGRSFEVFVTEMAKAYCSKTRLSTALTTSCKNCPFYVNDKKETDKDKKDGRMECWTQKAGLSIEDYKNKPLILELWGGAGRFIKNGSYLLENVKASDLEIEDTDTERANEPLKAKERKLLQIGISTNDASKLTTFGDNLIGTGIYLDKEGIKAEMEKWKYPLHFIDFETSAPALPFYKGMHPYEQVAFQFSHHIVNKNEDGSYSISHAGQYINTKKGFFPNFEFVRELKKQLEGDEGTIFRYATHENTILRTIRNQLIESEEKDKESLIAFIEDITKPTSEESNADRTLQAGKRNMVDLQRIVVDYFYARSMKGSNSIKDVLPAVLNASKFLQQKYIQPIYGSEIHSENIPAETPISWISVTGGVVDNPYKKLPSVASYLNMTEKEMQDFVKYSDSEISEDETIAQGGEALTAYAKLQFSNLEDSEALTKALLRYCELDTMAMVFIWEYFNKECFPRRYC